MFINSGLSSKKIVRSDCYRALFCVPKQENESHDDQGYFHEEHKSRLRNSGHQKPSGERTHGHHEPERNSASDSPRRENRRLTVGDEFRVPHRSQ